jgi:hypothetical protein
MLPPSAMQENEFEKINVIYLGEKIVMVPSSDSEVLSKFVEWRRMESLPLNRNFDRWYEAHSKENIWHLWKL